jgi:hypothetical protein
VNEWLVLLIALGAVVVLFWAVAEVDQRRRRRRRELGQRYRDSAVAPRGDGVDRLRRTDRGWRS